MTDGGRWVFGLPFVDRRPLLPREKRELSRLLSASHRAIAIGAVTIGAGPCLILLAVLVPVPPVPQAIRVLLMFGGIGMLLFGAPLGTQSLLRQRRLVRGLDDDLREAVVDRHRAPDEAAARLVLRDRLIDGDLELHSVEVLPRSRIVLSLNDEQPRRRVQAGEVVTAVIPSTYTAPLAIERDGVPTQVDESVRQRHQSGEERLELAAHAARLGNRGLRQTVLFVLLTAAFGAYALAREWDRALTVRAGITALAALGSAMSWAVNRRTATRLLTDRESGLIIVIDTGHGAIERLPTSRREWSREGTPALWRTLG